MSNNDLLDAHDMLEKAETLRDLGLSGRWWLLSAECSKHGLLVLHYESEGIPATGHLKCVACANEGVFRKCPVTSTTLTTGMLPIISDGEIK